MGIPQPKKKAVPIKKLKNKLWELCKQLTRLKYGNTCYTCGTRGLEGSNWHTGHFLTDSVCSTELSYDLANLRPQCYACNIHRSGNWPAFEEHLLRDGVDIEALKRRNRDTKGRQYDRLWYQAKIAEYELLLKQYA